MPRHSPAATRRWQATLIVSVFVVAVAGAALPAGGTRGSPRLTKVRSSSSPWTVPSRRPPAAGDGGSASPSIDALAAEAVVFDRAYTHSPLTLPAHASILAGQLPFEHGVRDEAGFALNESTRSLAELLRNRGFETGAAVSSFLLRRESGVAQGFSFFDADCRRHLLTRRPRSSARAPNDRCRREVAALAAGATASSSSCRSTMPQRSDRHAARAAAQGAGPVRPGDDRADCRSRWAGHGHVARRGLAAGAAARETAGRRGRGTPCGRAGPAHRHSPHRPRPGAGSGPVRAARPIASCRARRRRRRRSPISRSTPNRSRGSFDSAGPASSRSPTRFTVLRGDREELVELESETDSSAPATPRKQLGCARSSIGCSKDMPWARRQRSPARTRITSPRLATFAGAPVHWGRLTPIDARRGGCCCADASGGRDPRRPEEIRGGHRPPARDRARAPPSGAGAVPAGVAAPAVRAGSRRPRVRSAPGHDRA